MPQLPAPLCPLIYTARSLNKIIFILSHGLSQSQAKPNLGQGPRPWLENFQATGHLSQAKALAFRPSQAGTSLAVSKRRKKKNGGRTFAPAVFVVSGLLLYPCHNLWGGAYQVGEVCMVIGGGRSGNI